MRHGIERHGERHAGVEQVPHLLREGGELLELGPALAATLERRGHERALARFRSRGHGGEGAAARAFDHDGEQPETFDLHEGRGAIGTVEDALHDLAGLAFRFVGELWHS